MREDILRKLQEFHNYNIPGDIVSAGKSYIIILAGDSVNNIHKVKIRVEDVAAYYVDQATNIQRGIRTIAGISGDWRGIERIAHECLRWFKFIDRVQIRRVCRKHGLEPKF